MQTLVLVVQNHKESGGEVGLCLEPLECLGLALSVFLRVPVMSFKPKA